MNAMNPYAAPQMQYGQPGMMAPHMMGAWRREGDLLVVQKGATLPDVCVLTGERAGERVQKKLTWAPPWLGVVVAISPLIYLILYFVMRKQGDINYAVSEAAKKRRNTAILVGVGGTIGSILLFVAGAAAEAPALFLVAFLAFIVSIIVAAVMANPFRVTKIDEQFIYLKLQPAALDALSRG